jgi:hypothetical protein
MDGVPPGEKEQGLGVCVCLQMFDLAVGGDDGEEAQVEGMPAETYMERFSWDEAKYPPRRPLKETVSAVTDIVAELEDSLKVGPYYQGHFRRATLLGSLRWVCSDGGSLL